MFVIFKNLVCFQILNLIIKELPRTFSVKTQKVNLKKKMGLPIKSKGPKK